MKDEDEAAKMDSYRQTPLFQKAQEILGTTRRVVEFMNDEAAEKLEGYEKEMAQEYANQMYANALMIPAKIAAAHGANFYDMRMENAAIIRRAAREIMTSCSGLKMFQLSGFDYLDVLRAEIEEFRVLFAAWVSTFDPWDYIIDRWGLFNPPGVNYDDIDPDDDLPFDSNFEDDFED